MSNIWRWLASNKNCPALTSYNGQTVTAMSTQRTGSVDEKRRLKALDDYHILDTGPESQFDDIAALAANICETPMAAYYVDR